MNLDNKNEYILEFRLVQKGSTKILPKNHISAWDQVILNQSQTVNFSEEKNNLLKIAESTIYEIYDEKSLLHIDKKTGEILNWNFRHLELTNKPIKPNFWRPPTDNDLGNGMDKWAKSWQNASYNYTSKLIEKPKKTNGSVSFKVAYRLPNDEAKIQVKFTLTSNGSLIVNYTYKPNKSKLPNIPRLGMYLTLNNNFREVSWYGKGPEESYWDRKTGQKIGVYSKKITEQFYVYSRPQETGNKTDVRWMKVTSKDIKLKVSSQKLISSSTWPFNMKELDFNSDEGAQSASGLVPVTKKHGADIKIGNTIQWNIDYLQMGVGGDTSWGRLVHPEYTIPANKTYNYSFTITPSKK